MTVKMTGKKVKTLKNNNKHLKLKNVNAKPKPVESDSDISEPDASKQAPKIDQKALKQISSEVTDLLASLKSQHGIEDKPVVAIPTKKNKQLEKGKNKNEKKNPPTTAPAKKIKLDKQPEKNVAAQSDKVKPKKQKQTKVDDGAKKQPNPNAKLQPQLQNNAAKKNKKKNKKRAANDADVKEEATDVKPPAKKVKPNPKQKLEKAPLEMEPESDENTDENTDENIDENAIEDTPKKEHHLKNATPVFVGNLPINTKRLKLLKMFKIFGNILSIRFRTNTGKSFYKKSQVTKAPHLIAFLYFESPEAAEASLVLNGEKFGDNSITVDLDSEDRTAEVKPHQTIVVGNLKYAVTDNILREAFKCCGPIERIRTVQGERGCNGVAFIRFAKAESCALALKLNGTEILDREIRVENYKAGKSGDKKIKKEKTTKPVKFNKNFGGKANNKLAVKGAKFPGKGAKFPGIGAKFPGKGAKFLEKQGDKKKKNKEFLGVKSIEKKKQSLDKKKKKKNKLTVEKRLAQKVAPKAQKTA